MGVFCTPFFCAPFTTLSWFYHVKAGPILQERSNKKNLTFYGHNHVENQPPCEICSTEGLCSTVQLTGGYIGHKVFTMRSVSLVPSHFPFPD